MAVLMGFLEVISRAFDKDLQVKRQIKRGALRTRIMNGERLTKSEMTQALDWGNSGFGIPMSDIARAIELPVKTVKAARKYWWQTS